jgi:hypothetical protein
MKSDGEPKTFVFSDPPQAAYLKFEITAGKGDYSSGSELLVFKVPSSESYVPGDINHDGKIDRNDLTSYRNYTGLRTGDADFEGYISKGDIGWRRGLVCHRNEGKEGDQFHPHANPRSAGGSTTRQAGDLGRVRSYFASVHPPSTIAISSAVR